MKYDPLGLYLRSQTSDHVVLSWKDLETLVGQLPDDARTPQYWANAIGHHPSRRSQWLEAGYRAFYDPATNGVRFERILDQKQQSGGQPWTEAELRACVFAYREMMKLQEAGVPFKKSDWRRKVLDEDLTKRNKGSYEFRLQNISAVLDELGLEYLPGYLPRRNIGHSKAVIVRLINEYWHRENEPETPTDDPEKLDARVISARQKLTKSAFAVPKGTREPKKKSSPHRVFERDPNVIAWTLSVAAGKCEMCEAAAPFVRTDGEPYLEVHHIRPLGQGGPDQTDNAVAICPNCHRRLHHGADRESVRKKVMKKIARLVDYPVRETD